MGNPISELSIAIAYSLRASRAFPLPLCGCFSNKDMQ